MKNAPRASACRCSPRFATSASSAVATGGAEEDHRAEHVEEEAHVDRVRADDGEHQAPGFQIIRARIASMQAPAPHESAIVRGSLSFAASSELGASPSAASRSASRRFRLSRAAADPAGGVRRDPEDDRRDDPRLAVAVAEAMDEPEPEHEGQRRSDSDEHDGHTRQAEKESDLARTAAAEGEDAEDARPQTAPPNTKNAPETCSASSHWSRLIAAERTLPGGWKPSSVMSGC